MNAVSAAFCDVSTARKRHTNTVSNYSASSAYMRLKSISKNSKQVHASTTMQNVN